MEQRIPPVLRWYHRSAVDAAAKAWMDRAQAGLLGQLDLAEAMLAFRFRDSGGTYHFCDATQGRWYRFDGTAWRPAAELPERLEGVDALPVDVPLPPETDPPSPPTAAPSTVLAEAIHALSTAYAAGQINTLVAEALLGQRFLLDHEGRAWTVGVQSGQWYAFAQGAWSPAEGPPEPDKLARIRPPAETCPGCGQTVEDAGTCPHCGAAVIPLLEGVSPEAYGPIVDFLAYAGLPPEDVTAPWDPPPGYPDVQLPTLSRHAPLGTPQPVPQAAPASGGACWRLQAVSGPLAGQPVELGDRLRIGRAEGNELTLSNPGISRHHAVIWREGDGSYTIADQGSTNGTVVNGTRIAGPTRLHPGDQIGLCTDVHFVVAVEAPLGASTGRQGSCPTCGTPIRPGVKFCPQCGTPLA